MPVNRNALIRYKVIDSCLRNRRQKWTIEKLIDKVSDALFEYEGIDKGISRRTIQADIQTMRSDKLGYNAPIVVTEKKYYSYEDPAYSITQTPISEQDLSRMNEAVAVLSQFKGFSHFNQLGEVVQKLEDHVYAATHDQMHVIDFERNDNLKGLEYLDVLYHAIIQKKTVNITYRSFRAKSEHEFPFHPWWLKEFNNRWFAVGLRGMKPQVLSYALDRIIAIKPNTDIPYRDSDGLTPAAYYKDVIGASVTLDLPPERVILRITAEHAPYVLTKPMHPSQIILEQDETGTTVQLMVQLNFELERVILGYGCHMQVLAPSGLRERIRNNLRYSQQYYESDNGV
jgi:predicted DNA-binding transcriptional regulator YafY